MQHLIAKAVTLLEERPDIETIGGASSLINHSGPFMGSPAPALHTSIARKGFGLDNNLNLGRAEAIIYAADLTEAYVDFNKGDVSDPASLGG
ncbi:MAG: hypothetical protein HYY24_16050 [Verrucomicrobia bacterium]|nr:hypothetical protein [Verrucomicrobiota bacterium]